jgi:hypothetical protein
MAREAFDQRAQAMGLTPVAYKGLYEYSDRFGQIVYRNLATMVNAAAASSDEVHPTDGYISNLMGVFTKGPDDVDYQYCGYVSTIYQFIGNETLNENVRDAINSVGVPILEENPILWKDLTHMRNEIIIRNGQSVPQVGDVLPVVIVNNSYDGTKAASLSFGIAMNQPSVGRTVFGFSLGELKQIHIAGSNTRLSSAVSGYMQVFAQDITSMITESFSSTLTEDHMLASLDIIEEIGGKRRREKIASLLTELNPPQEEDAPPPLPSAWQIFLAITRYSSLEPNLNIRRMLENAAESVLVIPERMYGVLKQLQSS